MKTRAVNRGSVSWSINRPRVSWVGHPTEGRGELVNLRSWCSGDENEGDRPRVGELVTRPRVGWVGHPTEGRLGWSISGADVPEVKTRVTDQGWGRWSADRGSEMKTRVGSSE